MANETEKPDRNSDPQGRNEAVVLDSEGNPPTYCDGDLVILGPSGDVLTVKRQILHHDCGETFWGNLVLINSSGVEFVANCWQCRPA